MSTKKPVDIDRLIEFLRMSISAGTRPTASYTDAKTAGLGIRKQVYLDLYRALNAAMGSPVKTRTGQITPAEQRKTPPPKRIPPPERFCKPLRIYAFRDFLEGKNHAYYGINLYMIAPSEPEIFEDVRDHFANEFEMHFGMNYERSGMSIASYEDMEISISDTKPGFAFDIGLLKTGRIRYKGAWQSGRWKHYDMFDDFDQSGLTAILRGDEDENGEG